MISVGVVASNTAIRVGLREMINHQPGVSVAFAAINIEQAPSDAIDVLVLVSPATARHNPDGWAVLYLTDDPAELQQRFNDQTTVWGALPTDASEAEINIAIQALAEGLWVGAPTLMQKWLPKRMEANSPEAESLSQPLTAREIEVLNLAAQGMANKQIAARLSVSDHTIKFHLSSIYAKLNVSSRTEAVRVGVRNGLVVL